MPQGEDPLWAGVQDLAAVGSVPRYGFGNCRFWGCSTLFEGSTQSEKN